jgi:hypothetical protein
MNSTLQYFDYAPQYSAGNTKLHGLLSEETVETIAKEDLVFMDEDEDALLILNFALRSSPPIVSQPQSDLHAPAKEFLQNKSHRRPLSSSTISFSSLP